MKKSKAIITLVVTLLVSIALGYVAICGIGEEKAGAASEIKQGLDLAEYKGKTAVMYTYHITNYGDNDNVIANLIVFDGQLIGADLCDTSADNGFLVALNDKT